MRRGYGKVYLGEPEEGIVSFERAARLSPLDPFAFNNQIGMGLANFSLGRFDEALRLVTGALAERPGLTWPFRDVAVYRAWLGDLEGARDALEKFVYLRPVVTLQSIADSLRFMNASLLQRYVEGLRRAGLT
jgi:tetratricopeptide (TPR) repeat protein